MPSINMNDASPSWSIHEINGSHPFSNKAQQAIFGMISRVMIAYNASRHGTISPSESLSLIFRDHTDLLDPSAPFANRTQWEKFRALWCIVLPPQFLSNDDCLRTESLAPVPRVNITDVQPTHSAMNHTLHRILEEILGGIGHNTSYNGSLPEAFGVISGLLGHNFSSSDTEPGAKSPNLFARHNITQLLPPHPPHPFTVAVSEWWYMHKGALAATVLGLVCVIAILAAAGVWFCLVKPRRIRRALQKENKAEEGSVERKKEQGQDFSVMHGTDGSGESAPRAEKEV